MTEKVPIRVQHRRMTKAEWAKSPLILFEGEIGVETDTGYLKVGDGVKQFKDLQYLTGPKGEKGDPFRYEDLTPEQIEQIKAHDIDLSNYATKDDLASVDVSGQLKDYAKMSWVEDTLSSVMLGFADQYNSLDNKLNGKADKDHKHDEYVTEVGVNENGIIVFKRNDTWYNLGTNSQYRREIALKDHTHKLTDINGLQDALDSKASATHTHTIAEIANLETRLNEISKMEGPKGADGAKGDKGADGTSVTVEVVNSVPSNQAPNVIYLVKA